MKVQAPRIRWPLAALLLAGALALSACSSASKRPQPAELPPDAKALAVQPAWSTRIGPVSFPLDVKVVGDAVAVAASDGTVTVLDAATGAETWRASVGAELAAGVGFDGRWAAVLTRNNELVTLREGRELWRQRLAAQGFTAPLVAGNRVFVLAGDRSVAAFDAESGRRLWTQQRGSEPLALRHAGVLLPVGNTLVVGLSGKLVGLDPMNGNARWEAPLATPRGVNDIERLVDLVLPASRAGSMVCVRAFQAAIGCVDALRGNLLWTKPSNGQVGLGGNPSLTFSAEYDGTLVAWRRDNGERIWSSERLRFRGLSAPLAAPQALVVGDASGLLHFVSPDDGTLLTRVATDGTPLAGPPVLAGQTVVTVTRGGNVQAWRLTPP